ncbi:hypothetical protein ACA910_019661 [Epithemia clementina (nom. ined.)]
MLLRLFRTLSSSRGGATLQKPFNYDQQVRWGWNERGYDITYGSLYHSPVRPKVILEGYGPDGFSVSNVVKNVGDMKKTDGSIFMHGSIMAFPHGCFFWNVESVQDITVDSLAPIALHQPKINILLVGSNTLIPHRQMYPIVETMRKKYGISVEKSELFNAIGTFNFLNAEDRDVAVVLLRDPSAKTEN